VKILLVLRSLIVTLLIFPLMTLVSSLVVLFLANLGSPLVNGVIQFWARSVCWLYGVTVKVYYPENIRDGGFLLLFNHSSFFDIFAISSVLPEIRFGAKIELFKIPFFGSAMRAVGVIPISREEREKSVQELKNHEHKIAKGMRVALAPEGGRLGGEDFLAPFKSGPFYFALSSGAAIQPVLIQGASLIWPKGSLTPAIKRWKSEIKLIFLPQISTSSYQIDQRNELKNATFHAMDKTLKDWRQKEKQSYSSSSSSSSKFSSSSSS
jgi:1-acyl-sn-glycerol-3-phosphate acyltransferase